MVALLSIREDYELRGYCFGEVGGRKGEGWLLDSCSAAAEVRKGLSIIGKPTRGTGMWNACSALGGAFKDELVIVIGM